MAKSAKENLIAKIDADIVNLQNMRAYVLAADEAEPEAAPKTRKPRGKNKPKPGLPALRDAPDAT